MGEIKYVIAPEISVIIPVYNDPDGLKDTVLSFINQDYENGKFEIILADNGSKDDTFRIAESFSKEHPDLIKVVLENKIQTSYAARNKGIEISKGELLCFVDADMTVEPDYLGRIDDYFKCNSVDYLGCNVDTYSKKDTLTSKFNILNEFNIESFLEKSHFAPTCCLSVKKSVVDKVGDFDGRLESSGDFEFGIRVFEAGFRQKYIKQIMVHHPARWKYRSFMNKHRRIARGIAQLNYYHPGKYEYRLKRTFRLQNFLPSSPRRLYKECKNLNMPINWYSAIILSLFNLPVRIISIFAMVKENKRLGKLDNS